MCKAYRTVSLNSALLLTGTLPLDLRVQEAASLYKARKGAPRLELGDREIERMAPARDAPHPAQKLGIGFGSLVDEEQYALHSNYAVRIFTDGSKIEGKVGAAISVWSGNTEIKAQKFTLSAYCTVYQAELLALEKAIQFAQNYKNATVGIFSDSRAALETISNPNSPHPLAVEIRRKMAHCIQQNTEVSLFWIKAHSGLEGNERADTLAKEAALKIKRRPDYDKCPISFVRRNIRQETLDEWDKRYQTEETASITKMFFPEAKTAYKTIKNFKPNGITTQLFTGHGGFSSYLKRFRCKDDPSCVCEPGTEESVQHVILDCPVYGKRRFNLEQEMGLDIRLRISQQ